MTYTTTIRKSVAEHFGKLGADVDAYGAVFVTDCGQIRDHGALGAIWHRVDLATGQPDRKAFDLIESVCKFRQERIYKAAEIKEREQKRAMAVAEAIGE